MGEPNEVEHGRGGFYEYPSDCICQKTKGRVYSSIDHLSKDAMNIMEQVHTQLPRDSSNETESDYSHGNGLDIPEMDDMISD